MGGLSDLDYKVERHNGLCTVQDDVGRVVDVTVVNGCPMVSQADCRRLLEWLELFQVHQQRKLAVVKTLLSDPEAVDKSRLDLELALTAKLRQLFPDLPDQVLMRLVPNLEKTKTEGFGACLPWNRRKRRRLAKAANIVIHVFSGDDAKFWERHLSNSNTEVLCVDLLGDCKADLLDRNVYGYLLQFAASGRVRAFLGGPPCRTTSALRFQDDDGPRLVLNERHPYGLPDLTPAEMELVLGDAVLFFRYLSLYVLAEDVREHDDSPTQFILEQPEDPARYRSQEDVDKHGFMSVFRTAEWQAFQQHYGIHMIHFDQGCMGHQKRKPTTLATSMETLFQLDGLRGGPSQPPRDTRSLPLQQRIEESKRWASWAPGLKLALATAIDQHLQLLEPQKAAVRPSSQGLGRRGGPASSRQFELAPEQSNDEHFSVQHLRPDTLRKHQETMVNAMELDPLHQRPRNQRQQEMRALGPVALEQ